MARVIQNFLVGVGMDTKGFDSGMKNVTDKLMRTRSLVGFAGAAFSGAFSLAGSMAITAANRVDQYHLSVEKLRSSPEFIYSFGRALAALGGDAQDAVSAINAAEDALDQLELKGNFGAFEEAAFAGMRDELRALTQAADGEEFMRILAGAVPGMSKGQQRLIQDAWGFSDATMRSLRQGSDEFDRLVNRASDLYGEFGKATDQARDFNRAITEINTRFQGIGETLAEKMLPGFTSVIDSIGWLIDKSRGGIETAATIAGENAVGATLVGAGAATAGAGAALRGVGMSRAGSFLTRLGLPGMAVGGGMMAWDLKPDDIESMTGWRPNDYIFNNTPADAWEDLKGWLIRDRRDRRRIYSGGEIGPEEGSNLNPEIIMIRDGRARDVGRASAPRLDVQNQIDLRVEIDGRELDARVVEVIDRREAEVIEDMRSTVRR